MRHTVENREVDGDLKWQFIINDPCPRPALSALGDEVEDHHRQSQRPEPVSSAGGAGEREDVGAD